MNKLFLFFFLVFLNKNLCAQVMDSIKENSFNYLFEVQTIATNKNPNHTVPFWLRSQQYGSIPLDGLSISGIASVKKDYNYFSKKVVDWGMGIELRANAGNKVEGILTEGYLKGRLGFIELKAGRVKEFMGLVDSLSSGSFSLSGNALGIPQISLGVPQYVSIPFINNLIAFKGSISHGWMGKTLNQFGQYNGQRMKAYYHHASLFGRFGKPTWRLKLYGAINHDVIWGSDKEIFAPDFDLSTAQSFWYVLTGKKYNKSSSISKVGNHLGSIDLGLEYDFKTIKLFAYRQQFYDKGALGYLANILDGLNGLALTNKKENNKRIGWKKIVVEFFYSKNQAGEENAKWTPSGPELYYNHAVQYEGFSYKGTGLGNPFINPVTTVRKGFPHAPNNFFINNRVAALYLASIGHWKKWQWLMKLSFSRNWGTYETSDVVHWWFNGSLQTRVPVYGIFPTVNQFSGYWEANTGIRHNTTLGIALAIDEGDLLYNGKGIILKIRKKI